MAFCLQTDHHYRMPKSSRKTSHKPHSTASKRISDLESRLDKLEETLFQTRKAAQNVETRLQNEILGLKLQIKEKDALIDTLKKSNTYLQTKLFGSQSEKKTVKALTTEEAEDSKSQRKKGQQPGSKGHGRSVKSVAKKVEVDLQVEQTCCPKCSTDFLLLEATKDSKLIEYHQFLEETTYKRQVAVSQCKCFGKVIKVADMPRKLFPRTDIGNSLWTHFLLGKYLFGVPTNRIQKALSLKELNLPLGTLNYGFKRIDGLLTSLYEQMQDHAKAADLWNADETSWRIMDAENRKFWLWVIASSDAAVYIMDQSRSAKVPKQFFEDSSGILVSDRFSAYKSLKELIKTAWCWVHVRRDFLAVFKGVKKHKTWAARWLQRIGKLFAVNHKRFKLFEAEKCNDSEWQKINEELVSLLEKFQKEFKREISQNKLDDIQLKVLRSLNKHWAGLTLFASDCRIPMDNNRAERLLRGAVNLRKNSNGSGAAWSGQLAAKVLTLFHTWLINGLNPEALMEAFLDDNSMNCPAPDLKQYLPWSMSAARRKEFSLPASYKRPA